MTVGVFPAHAGMSLAIVSVLKGLRGFPRTRGDEPARIMAAGTTAPFSPHTRG